MNIISIPRPSRAAANRAAVGPGSAISGKMSNGYTRVFADLSGNAGSVNIEFSVDVNSVIAPDFHVWRQKVSEILTPSVEGELARYAGIGSDSNEDGRYASQYSLAAFSYVMAGVFTSFLDRSDFAFSSLGMIHAEQGSWLMDSIRELRSSLIKLAGTLTATTAHPDVEALISATYFAFDDATVTSFVSYPGSILLVHGDEKVETQPGILSPVPSNAVALER